LVNNNWGGTPVEHWSTPDAFASCGRNDNDGSLYNAMIHPYVVGPMALTGFTWYQGEKNTRDQNSADMYGCLFPAMIAGWRKVFNNPSAYFGYVQLSTWCGGPAGISAMRDAQQMALKLPNVGYATNTDHGAGCNIHPPPKQYCGTRLGNSALAIAYKQPIQWKSPSFESASSTSVAHPTEPNTAAVSVTVSLHDASAAGMDTSTYPFNYVRSLTGQNNCTELNAKTPNICAWASVLSNGKWVNATVTSSGANLVLTAAVALDLTAGETVESAAPSGSSYGWGAIPMMNAYDKGTGLPVLPWNTTTKTNECLVGHLHKPGWYIGQYCCPDAKRCLAPIKGKSCSDATACAAIAGAVCCPLTKMCVIPGAPCETPCDGKSFCCPDAKHCLTPVSPGTFCTGGGTQGSCATGQVCCPLTAECVSVGAVCVPP
jgi:hypothetical protein